MLRQILALVLGLLLIIGAVFAARKIVASKKKPKRQYKEIVKTVFTEKVVNGSIPVTIKGTGQLVAKNKIELFSEVQGVLRSSGKDFRTGVAYSKGELIFSVNDDEFRANIQAQRSNLLTAITQIMPDLKLDFPDVAQKWQDYLNQLDIEKNLAPLPETTSDKEKYFISGRGIYATYYNIKNLEVKLTKYKIRAPFYGVVTESNVNTGTLIRPGQKLGELVSPGIYELEVGINAAYMGLLKPGKKVDVTNLEGDKKYTGTILRLNGKVEPSTQTIKVFIEVTSKDLKEGIYLVASLPSKMLDGVYEMDRKLVTNNMVYAYQDSNLVELAVEPIFYSEDKVIVRGLPEGTKVLARPVPGAHPGMKVKEFQKKQ